MLEMQTRFQTAYCGCYVDVQFTHVWLVIGENQMYMGQTNKLAHYRKLADRYLRIKFGERGRR